MQPNKVIVRFKDGMIIKGNTSDFFLNKVRFHLNRLDGKLEEIDIETLKAVFSLRITKAIKIIKRNMKIRSMVQDVRSKWNLQMVNLSPVMPSVIHQTAMVFS